MGDKANTLLQNVDMQSLSSLLCNYDSTHWLFGALSIGNISSRIDLQQSVFDSGALQPLIGLSEIDATDAQSKRSMVLHMLFATYQLKQKTT